MIKLLESDIYTKTELIKKLNKLLTVKGPDCNSINIFPVWDEDKNNNTFLLEVYK